MKIDLHCHTLKAKKGDGETRNIDAKQFRTIMNDKCENCSYNES